ncbi:12433_t:CDS:2 [Ambispora gerdemannii]|uniref:12433_t:CDS:1 n=1 Tax=Ambispora gerdemannii TaxID=144530 RepID=A0A9N9AAZ0_9GLOM|nr:12433_t:CDS:2 [Ambispora gerdemannii]
MSRKKYSFAELEGLIKQARQQKLAAKQKAQREKRESHQRIQREKEQSRIQHKKRLGEIYGYFRQELNKLDRSKHPEYFTAHLSLDPVTKKGLQRLSRKHPDYDFYAEFKKNKKNLVYQLNKGGRDYLLKQTTRAYQEEIAEQARQKVKFFFPEKGEHKVFFGKKKEFKEIWQEILTSQGSIQDRARPTKAFAIGEMLRKTKPEGELVSDNEIELDKYGKPKFKEGQVISLNSNKPGRRWSVSKNVPSLEKQAEKEVHLRAQESYINEHGTELEKDIFFNRRKNNFLCVIEAMGFDCRANQGTSEP